MPVEIGDLERLALEVRNNDMNGPEWLHAKTDVSDEAMKSLLEEGAATVADRACCRAHLLDQVVEVIGESFRLGWELRDQYGSKHTEQERTLCPVHEPGACPKGCGYALSFDESEEE